MLLVDIPYTGYTREQLERYNINATLKACKFNMMVARVRLQCTSPVLREYTVEEIYEQNIHQPEVQPNTIYFYCEFANVTTGSKVMQALKGGRHMDYVPEIITLANVSNIGLELNSTRHQIRKDMIFRSPTGAEIGWYNLYTNIAWLSDLGYHPELFYNEHLPLILSSIAVFQERGRIINELNIVGADPEFELVNTTSGRLILPTNYIRDPEFRNPIGLDHFPEVGELRPAPASSPRALTRNIKRLLRQLIRDIIPAHSSIGIYSGGGLYRNTGGHLHFNVNLQASHIKHILHDLISQYVRASLTGNRRLEGRYMDRDGRDVVRRAETHGGYEWRALPSFLVSQEIAHVLITTTWVVLDSIVNGVITEKEVVNTDHKDIFRRLRLYPYYMTEIDRFIEMFVAQKTPLDGRDIRPGWPIPIRPIVNNVVIETPINWVSQALPATWVQTKSDTTGVRIEIDYGHNVFDVHARYTNWIPALNNILSTTQNPWVFPFRVFSDNSLNSDIRLEVPSTFTYEQIELQTAFPKFRDEFQQLVQSLCITLIQLKEEV